MGRPYRWTPLATALAAAGALVFFLLVLPSSRPLGERWSRSQADRDLAIDVVREAFLGHPPEDVKLRGGPRRVWVSLFGRGWTERQEADGPDVATALRAAVKKFPPRNRTHDLHPEAIVVVDVETGREVLSGRPTASRLETGYETGLDGIRVEVTADPSRFATVLPSDPVTDGWFSPRVTKHDGSGAWATRGDEGEFAVTTALARLQRASGPLPPESALTFIRFRTESFLGRFGCHTDSSAPCEEAQPSVALYRGMPDHPYAPSPDEILAAAAAGGEWLASAVGTDGRFTYTYLPNRNAPSMGGEAGSYNAVRHAASAWMLVKLGKRFQRPRWIAAGERAVRWIERFARTVPDPKGPTGTRVTIDAPDETPGGLGHVAVTAIALAEMKQDLSPGEETMLKGLGRTLETLLRDDGGFYESEAENLARPKDKKDQLLYEPGEGLLALVTLAELYPSEPHWLASAKRSAAYRVGVYERTVPHTLAVDRVHWDAQALERLSRLTGERSWAEVAVSMGDAMLVTLDPPADLATTASNWPIGPAPHDYWGCFPMYGHPPRTTATGSRSEALNASRRAEILLGRDPSRFEEALKKIHGFQMRNQYTRESCYWCPVPEKAVGAFRAGVTDNEIRIDYIQHIVAGMGDTLEWYRPSPTSSSAATQDR